MPKFRIQLKQGSRTIINRIEAKSLTHVLDFFNSLTTMQVSEVIGDNGAYFKDDTLPPMDDFLYYPYCKFFAYNEVNRVSNQVVIHHLKLTKNMDDVALKCSECLETNTFNVTSIYSFILKNKKQ